MTRAAAGTAFATKQPSVVLVFVFMALDALFSKKLKLEPSWRRPLRDLPAFAAGYALALLPWLIHFAAMGTLRDVWFHLVARHLAMRDMATSSRMTGTLFAKALLLKDTVQANKWLWLLALLGGLGAIRRRQWLALVPIIWCGAYAVFLVLVYYEPFPHYLLAWIPGVSLLAGLGAAYLLTTFLSSLKKDALGAATRFTIAGFGFVAMVLGVKLLQFDQGDLASFGLAAAAAMFLRCLLPLPKVGRWKRLQRIAKMGLIACLALSVLGAYWSKRHIYRIPTTSLAQEREAAQWVSARLRSGDDVAVLASNALTVHGKWRELPIVWQGRELIAPMWLTGALRSWSPNPSLIERTINLWEERYRVRFLIIREDHWQKTAMPKNQLLRSYIEKNFQLLRTFRWPDVDASEYLHIHMRRTPFRSQF